MAILSLLTFILLNLKSNIIVCKTKYMNIKSLKYDKYFLVYDTNIYIWDYNNENPKSILNFKSIEPADNIIIIKHIYNKNIYIFCLIRDYLHIYVEQKNQIFNFSISQFLEGELLYYKYYNIIPYNTKNNKLNFIVSSLKEEIKEENCILLWWCDEIPYYYNTYLDYNIYFNNNQNLKYSK